MSLRHTIRSIIQEAEDYRGMHQAPGRDWGSPLYDLTLNGMYPADVYSPKGLQYYGNGRVNDPLDRESMNIILAAHNKPDMRVKIYRAVPVTATSMTINPGDWVTIVKSYAKEHGDRSLNGKYKIVTMTVRARDIFTEGNSIHEWGYDPA